MTAVAAVLVHVADVAEGLAWYERGFAASRRVIAQADDYELLDVDGVALEIVPADEKVGCGAAGSVVYWRVPDLDAALARFESLGAAVYRGPMAIEGRQGMGQVRDPWGNCIGLRGPWPAREVVLREVEPADTAIFFEHQRDPRAVRMAAFTAADPNDRAAFERHWRRLFDDPGILKRTVVCDGRVVGQAGSFESSGEREVTYWIDRMHWRRGIAQRALAQLLTLDPCRPLFARAAKDNAGSIAVLERCGFCRCGEDRGYAEGRGEVTEEFIFRLDAEGPA